VSQGELETEKRREMELTICQTQTMCSTTNVMCRAFEDAMCSGLVGWWRRVEEGRWTESE